MIVDDKDKFVIDYFPINSNPATNTGYTVKNNSFGKFEKDYEINNGERNFVLQELEIFQILYD